MTEAPPRCAPFEPDLSALLDGELSESRAAQVRAHVAECERCTGRLAALRQVDESLRGLPIPSLAPDLGDRVRQRIAAEAGPSEGHVQARRSRARRWLPLAATALAAGLVLVLVLGRGPEELPEEIQLLAAVPAPSDLEEVSDAEIELALAVEAVGGVETAAALLEDWELIEQLDLLERLETLESREHG